MKVNSVILLHTRCSLVSLLLLWLPPWWSLFFSLNDFALRAVKTWHIANSLIFYYVFVILRKRNTLDNLCILWYEFICILLPNMDGSFLDCKKMLSYPWIFVNLFYLYYILVLHSCRVFFRLLRDCSVFGNKTESSRQKLDFLSTFFVPADLQRRISQFRAQKCEWREWNPCGFVSKQLQSNSFTCLCVCVSRGTCIEIDKLDV